MSAFVITHPVHPWDVVPPGTTGIDKMFRMAYYETSIRTASSSATSLVTGTALSSAYEYSPVYSAGGSAPCIEQIFTQMSDPSPHTEDWTKAITTFTAADWEQFKMTARATTFRAQNYGALPSPIFRAMLPSGIIGTGYVGQSAYFAVDGINTSADGGWKSAGSRTYTASTEGWEPMSSIAGTWTGEMSACVSVFDPMFNASGSASSYLRSVWSSGGRSSIASPDGLSGLVQFRRTKYRTIITSQTATSTSTSSSISATIRVDNSDPKGYGEP